MAQDEIAGLEAQLAEARRNADVGSWGGSEADREHWLRRAGEVEGAIARLKETGTTPERQQFLEAQFQSVLNRPPNPEEIKFFDKILKSGDLQPYEVGLFLQNLPEVQQPRLEAQGKQLEGYLGASDTELLGRAADVARGQAVRLGRPDTSMIGSQIASAGRDLAINRRDILANFYGGGLQNISNWYANMSNQSLGRAYGLRDETRTFERDKQLAQLNYDTQKRDYQNALNDYYRRSKNQTFAGLAGASIGAGLGALTGNPYAAVGGANLGYRLGSSLGS